MAFPGFEPDGLLATAPAFAHFDGSPIYSGHPCTRAELEDALVIAFPQSHTRAALFKQMELLLGLAAGHLPCLILVVSGEFVTNADDPHDIFVVIEVVGTEIENLDGNAQWLLDFVFDAGGRPFGADDELIVQTGIVRAYPPDHIKFDLGNAERMTQRYLASSPVPETDKGGYLEILECEGGLNELDEIFAPPAP